MNSRFFIALAALLTLALPSCNGPSTVERGAASGYNLLLISIDTTRADRLGAYGYAAAETPAIDQLAQTGLLFERCYSPAPLTLPSHSSLFTGLDPFVHGARDNGSYRLNDSFETLTERLAAAGYATAGEVAAYVLNAEFGLDQGFESYGDTQSVSVDDASSARFVERRGDEIADAAIHQLQQLSGSERPFFLFVHFFDPHAPYEAPDGWADSRPHPYDGEIAWVDHQVGRLFSELERSGAADRTIVVLTSDHGESLGEHGEETHAVFLYDSTQHVPLLIAAPGKLPQGRRLSEPVRTIDIAPTLLDLLGLPALAAQGESLLPRVGGDKGAETAYAESLYAHLGYGYAPLRSWRRDRLKYIHAPTAELYATDEDPAETINLAKDRPSEVAQLRAELAEWIRSSSELAKAGAGASRTIDDESLAKLQSLGYVGAAGGSGELDEWQLFAAEGDDPKDHLVDLRISATLLGLLRDGDWGAAEGVARQFVEINPQSAIAEGHLATLLSRRGAHEEALDHYRRAAELVPTSDRLSGWGIALEQLGQLEAALDVHATAIKSEPVFADSFLNYARALHRAGESEQAAAQYAAALAMAPRNLAALQGLGRLNLVRRQPQRAAELFQRALAENPEDPRTLRGLGDVALQLGEYAAALDHFREAVTQDSENPAIRMGICLAAASLQRWDEAESGCREALRRTSDRGRRAAIEGRLRQIQAAR